MSNQTIDGVSRGLLEAFAAYVADSPNAIMRARARELRALLGGPAYQNRLCHIDYTAHPYICGCLKGDEEAQRRFDEHQAKAAQPQGEPVEDCETFEYQLDMLGSIDRCNVSCGSYGDKYHQWDDAGPYVEYEDHVKHIELYKREIERLSKLYAEQPAPVAVASRDESIAWLKRIDGIGQNRAELIYSMGFRRHTEVPQS